MNIRLLATTNLSKPICSASAILVRAIYLLSFAKIELSQVSAVKISRSVKMHLKVGILETTLTNNSLVILLILDIPT